jgi:hypothetical protein
MSNGRCGQTERRNAHVQIIIHLIDSAGVLAIIVGIIASPGPGRFSPGLLFAIYAFIDAGLQAYGHLAAGPRDRSSVTCSWGWLTWRPEWSLVWPAHRAGAGADRGSGRSSAAFEIFAAFLTGERGRPRAVHLVGCVVDRVVLFARNVGAVTLALLFGLFSIIGVSQIDGRGTADQKTLDSVGRMRPTGRAWATAWGPRGAYKPVDRLGWDLIIKPASRNGRSHRWPNRTRCKGSDPCQPEPPGRRGASGTAPTRRVGR